MKMATLARAFGIIVLVSVSSATKAEVNMATATNNCKEEAVSTGLQDETDISAYVNLCMQAWQTPPEYTESVSASEDPGNPPAETSVSE